MINKILILSVVLPFNFATAKNIDHEGWNEYKEKYHHKLSSRKKASGAMPIIDCDELLNKFNFPNTNLTESTFISEGEECSRGSCTPVPNHCKVRGVMNERIGAIDGKPYGIGFEMRLPTDWTGRFFYQANGGVDGNIAAAYGNILGGSPTSNGLLKGFAVVSSDAGHPTRSADFGIDPQARIDYGYNAVAELTPMSKQLIKAYYGKKPDTSYIIGTSNGGRHAMVAASRHFELYDGVLASAPGFNLPKAAVAQLWGVQQFASIVDNNPETSRPDIGSSFSLEDTALISKKILEKCDALDGASDEWVGNPMACQNQFNIQKDIATCDGSNEGDCLSYGQKSVLTRIHAGAMTSWGQVIYSNFLWDPGILSSSWRTWKFVFSTTNRDPVAVGYIFTTPPQLPEVQEKYNTSLLDYALNWDDTGFNVDRDALKIFESNEIYSESAMSFMTPPDLMMKKFRAKGGKMIVVHGTADPVFSAADTINWYQDLKAFHKRKTSKFAQLFLVPGMGHSRGGPAADQYDLVESLVNWVEKGKKPKRVEAKARGGENSEVPASWSNDRTRPLCAFPKTPMYSGTGDVENADFWYCKK
jgi:feruloyl esterase